MSPIRTIIFDLDGTLTDTLRDLCDSTNYALRQMGWPERSMDEVRRFVGNGVRKLIERAVPDYILSSSLAPSSSSVATPSSPVVPSSSSVVAPSSHVGSVGRGSATTAISLCFSHFQHHYLQHCQDHTCLYPGVAEMLRTVHARGYRTAIVSNKLQAGVDELYATYFRDVVDVAIGQREGIPLKPAPDMVELALRELGATKATSIYVGDSEVDVQTARNASLPCVSVLWGFRDREQLLEAGATYLITQPNELLELLSDFFVRK